MEGPAHRSDFLNLKGNHILSMDTPRPIVVSGQRTVCCPEIVPFPGATDTAVYSGHGQLLLMEPSGKRTLSTRVEIMEDDHFSSHSTPGS